MEAENSNLKQFTKRWALHALIYWAIKVGYYCFDYYLRIKKNGKYFIFYEDGSPLTVAKQFYDMNRYEYEWFKAILFVLMVELLRKYLYNKEKFALFIFSCFVGGTIWSLMLRGKHNLKFNEPFTFGNTFVLEIITNFALYAIIYAVSIEFITQKLYKKEVRIAKSQSELNALVSQVNPHFFFNTFNYVYGTALQEKASNTAKAIEMMTEMMRYAMSVTQEKLVPLSEELHFITNYVNLQLLRLPKNESISISINIPKANLNGMITPMLIIPLIENAFKYGISIDHKSFIKITISTSENKLTLNVENSIPPTTIHKGFGTGLSNVKERLRLLYPRSHHFSINHTEDHYRIEISFPIK